MGLLSWLFGRRPRQPDVDPTGDESALAVPRLPTNWNSATISAASSAVEPAPVVSSPVDGQFTPAADVEPPGPAPQVIELSETHVAVLGGPGGAVTILDREAFDYSRGVTPGTDPRQADLDELLARVDRVCVRAGGVFRGAARESDSLLDTDEPAAVRALADCLRIDPTPATFGHCNCLGGPALELFAGGECVATLGVHHGTSIRWVRWKHDARLAVGRRLDDWLHHHGVEPELLKLIYENNYQPGPVRPLPPRDLSRAEQWVCLAEAAARAGDLPAAQERLSQALKLEPGLPLAHAVRGFIHRDAGLHPAAVRDLTVALEAGFQHPDILFQRALSFDEMGHARGAAADCTAALELAPEHSGALNLRGYLRSLTGSAEEALEDLDTAARLAPGWYVPRFHRGCLRFRRGDFPTAAADFGEAFAVLTDNSPPVPPGVDDPTLKPAILLLWWRAEAARAGDDPAAADADVDRARERDAYWSAGIGGDLLNQIGESDRAEAEFTRAIELRPLEDEPYLGRALARLRTGRADDAVADYDVVVARRPGAPALYGLRAAALAAAGRFAEALADCETRLRLTPGDPAARLDRGRVYLVAGQPGRALEDFEAAALISAHHPTVTGHLVWLLAGCGDDAIRDGLRAEAYARAAVEATGGSDPWLLEALAAAQAEVGHFDDAIETQEKALDTRPGPPSEDGLFRLRRYRNSQPFRLDGGAGLPNP